MATYSKYSPYYNTGMYGQFLDILTQRTITRKITDPTYTITSIYHLRPDLLANDLYGDSRLWWVFAARNPNTLKDPLMDFKAGETIFLVDKDTVIKDLGL